MPKQAPDSIDQQTPDQFSPTVMLVKQLLTVKAPGWLIVVIILIASFAGEVAKDWTVDGVRAIGTEQVTKDVVICSWVSTSGTCLGVQMLPKDELVPLCVAERTTAIVMIPCERTIAEDTTGQA